MTESQNRVSNQIDTHPQMHYVQATTLGRNPD